MKRPNFTVPTWSTEGGTYTAPGKDWNGTPTIVDPGSSFRAVGHTPDTRPVAMHENWRAHQVGKQLEWLSIFPLLNYTDFGAPTDLSLINVTALQWCPSRKRYYACGFTGSTIAMRSSTDLLNWDVETISSPKTDLTPNVLLTNGSGLMVMTGHGRSTPNDGIWYSANKGDSFSKATLPFAQFDFWSGVYGSSLFVVGGQTIEIGDDTPCVFTSSNGSAWTERTLPTPPTGDVGILSVAHGAGVFVALSSGFATEGQVYWTSPDGETWTIRYAPLIAAETYTHVTYSEATGRFVFVGAEIDGTGEGYSYVSTDGITLTAGGEFDLNASGIAILGLVSAGSAFIMMTEDDGVASDDTDKGRWFISTDNADTWQPFNPALSDFFNTDSYAVGEMPNALIQNRLLADDTGRVVVFAGEGNGSYGSRIGGSLMMAPP